MVSEKMSVGKKHCVNFMQSEIRKTLDVYKDNNIFGDFSQQHKR